MKPEALARHAVLLAGIGIGIGIGALLNRSPIAAPQPTPTGPTGLVGVLVDDLPSGRMVECVLARDTTGPGVAVSVTCDWQGAVSR